MEWPVTVETLPDHTRQSLNVTVEDGEVVVVPPPRPFIVPPSSDDDLCDAIRQARQVQQGMGRGLT